MPKTGTPVAFNEATSDLFTSNEQTITASAFLRVGSISKNSARSWLLDIWKIDRS